MSLSRLGAATAAAVLLGLLTGVAPALAQQTITPVLGLHVQTRHGAAGATQRVTGSVEFRDPYAGGTYPADNGVAVLQRRLGRHGPWRKVQIVRGAAAGAPVFGHVTRLQRSLRYRLCYRGGRVVTYDAGGHEVDLRLAPRCGPAVAVRVTS